MGIDLNKDLDKKIVRRISNLEERVKDIFTSQKQFSTASQLTELLAAITLEIETLKEINSSLERRVSIIEDNPDL